MKYFREACFYASDQKATASEAAVECAMMSGSRLSSIVYLKELNELVSNLPLNFDHWIGLYRGDQSNLMTVADGRRTLMESDFANFESSNSPNRSACASCNCVIIDETQKLKFIDCSEEHHYICEMKGESI